jgi:transposase
MRQQHSREITDEFWALAEPLIPPRQRDPRERTIILIILNNRIQGMKFDTGVSGSELPISPGLRGNPPQTGA